MICNYCEFNIKAQYIYIYNYVSVTIVNFNYCFFAIALFLLSSMFRHLSWTCLGVRVGMNLHSPRAGILVRLPRTFMNSAVSSTVHGPLFLFPTVVINFFTVPSVAISVEPLALETLLAPTK